MREFAKWHGDEWVRRQGLLAGIALLFAVTLAWLGAFGSSEFEPFARIGYWTVIFMAQYALAVVTMPLLRVWPLLSARTMGQRVAIGAAITSVPMFFVTAAASMSVGTWTPVPSEIFQLIVAIWIIGGAYLFLWEKLSSRPYPAPIRPGTAESFRAMEQPQVDSAPIQGLLLNRLPPELGREIICLGNEDHYVRVHTAVGNTLILMRFADALGGVSAIDGQRVHRSWWVSRSAVVRLERSGRTARLELRNGLSVPVSRPYLDQAKSLWGAIEGIAVA
ncbi:LytTR family DNA-binding domain-containing protein [Sphingobium chlorophenolicum]|uniref:Response regulator receiver protein n=1 Tax=Sphingobium chlorophenolicum TaxID=46429 RepID=A0A081R9X2_SPHCR|nr:LytTR family transcriptional regulator DNA-binding domain-containing protein [Sphingobium chlorophenolicum]KEQ51995.1 Response regulator receiver protein [Sphingobium chlorophenolicum]